MKFHFVLLCLFISSAHGLTIRRGSNVVYERLLRLKRQSTPGTIKFGQNQGANIQPLAGVVPDTNIDATRGGQVNVARPSVSAGKDWNILGLFQRQQGVQNAGMRENNNYGATWGNQNNILGNLIGFGNKNDVNFNGNNGQLNVQKQKGIPGIATETAETNVNPLGLQFGTQTRKCFGGMFVGGEGICTNSNKGLGPGR